MLYLDSLTRILCGQEEGVRRMWVSLLRSGPAAAAGALKTKIEVHVTGQDALEKVADVIKQAEFCAPTFSTQICPLQILLT